MSWREKHTYLLRQDWYWAALGVRDALMIWGGCVLGWYVGGIL